MSDPTLAAALDQAEQALDRIERATRRLAEDGTRETQLREKVHAVVTELDEMIRAAGGR